MDYPTDIDEVRRELIQAIAQIEDDPQLRFIRPKFKDKWVALCEAELEHSLVKHETLADCLGEGMYPDKSAVIVPFFYDLGLTRQEQWIEDQAHVGDFFHTWLGESPFETLRTHAAECAYSHFGWACSHHWHEKFGVSLSQVILTRT